MIHAVIIGHNEGNSIPKMLESTSGLERLWVLDRCDDGSRDMLSKANEEFIEFNEGEGRRTSFLRNSGLLRLMDGLGDDGKVLFLDGDRYPVRGDLKALEDRDTDVTLLTTNDNDERLMVIDDYGLYYGRVNNLFYSCGVMFKRSAIDKVLEFNGGKLFDEDLQRYWGVEDVHLGDVCYHLGLTCGISGDVILNGALTTRLVDADALVARFTKRDKLNVKW